MNMQNPLLVVRDMDRAKAFYRDVLGLEVALDFGANVTLTGGLCLQTLESWLTLTGLTPEQVAFENRDGELYFEEEAFDAFLERLGQLPQIRYVHSLRTHPWGQRVVRFYDPDGHIIEVGESIQFVCRRFLESGMTAEETARRMDVPVGFVESCI